MASVGSLSTPDDLNKWPVVSTFLVLGHRLQPNGSIRECWSSARASMWRAYWGNSGSRDAAHLGASCKAFLMNRAVLPQLSFRCSRWPPQQQIAGEVDRMQQKMTASALRLPFQVGEDVDSYVRRRGRIARKLCHKVGSWSSHWFTRAQRWDEHLARSRNANTWAARLREYHGKQWLMDKRAQLAPPGSSAVSTLAGRTGTRALPGKVQMRWHDGIDFARSRTVSQ
jgi:hypothetical protein